MVPWSPGVAATDGPSALLKFSAAVRLHVVTRLAGGRSGPGSAVSGQEDLSVKAFTSSWLLCLLLRQARGLQPGTWQVTLQDSYVGQLCRPAACVFSSRWGAQSHPSHTRSAVVLAEAKSRFLERLNRSTHGRSLRTAGPHRDGSILLRTLFVLPVSSPLGVAKEAQCDKCVESRWPGGRPQESFTAPTRQPSTWVGWGEAKCVSVHTCQGLSSGVTGTGLLDTPRVCRYLRWRSSGPRPRQLVRLYAG